MYNLNIFLEITRISVPVYVLVPLRAIRERKRSGRKGEWQKERAERKETKSQKPTDTFL